MGATATNRSRRQPAFQVDKQGLAKLLARRGKEFCAVELIQNAFDEDTKNVVVSLTRHPKTRGRYILRVEDDNPEGFADITHAYTLFAESKKKVDPEKRGRFNLGEKLVVAVCDRASVTTTTGTVIFEGDSRRRGRECTQAGSVFEGELRMTREEVERTRQVVRSIIVPKGVKLEFNGEVIGYRKPLAEFRAKLPTEISDAEGYLRPTVRTTTVQVFEPLKDEVSSIYEIGLPVVETGDQWHVNIGQKIPLSTDRDNVTPGYLRKVRTLVLNHMHEHIGADDATTTWIGEALASKDVTDKAVEAILSARYGDKRVIRDPSDPEGTKIAVSKGYAVIEPRSFNSKQWEQIRRSGAVLPAGQVTPSPKPFHPDGRELKVLEPEDWTNDMRRVAAYAKEIAQRLIARSITVRIADDDEWRFVATYGDGRLTLNASKKGGLGREWFMPRNGDGLVEPRINELLIHEFAHEKVSDHLSNRFHEECCVLGARLADAVVGEPWLFLWSRYS
jgi:hypothetical protein